MELKKIITEQFRAHRNYANSFVKDPSNSNRYYHPKTKKIISFGEMSWLIDIDAEKRANAIIKKISQ